jgi:hypothetical protein
MENIMLFAMKQLHVGGQYMLGRIIKMRFGHVFDLVTVRYEENPDHRRGPFKDKEFKVYKVQGV